MVDFTYEVPDEKKFFLAVRQVLSKSSVDAERAISDKLANAKCTIVTTSQFFWKTMECSKKQQPLKAIPESMSYLFKAEFM